MQMGGDAVAKIFTQVSNARGEITQKDLEAYPHPFKNPPKFIKQATQKLAEEFLLKKTKNLKIKNDKIKRLLLMKTF